VSERRRALGRGLGALIPSGPGEAQSQRPVDVFFRDRQDSATSGRRTAQSSDSPTEESPSQDPQPASPADSPADSASGQEPAETSAHGFGSDEVGTDGESSDGALMSASEAVLLELETAQAPRSCTRNKLISSTTRASTSTGSRGGKAATSKTGTGKTASSK